MNELELYAAFVHGAVTVGNLLGLAYNLRRRNWVWAALHATGACVHVYATRQHARSLR